MSAAGTPILAIQQLDLQLRSKGIPIIGVSGGPPWVIAYDPSATQAQKDQGDALAAAFDGKDRRYRSMFSIYADVAALTTLQKGRIWNNLGAGGDKLYYHDLGINVAAIMVWDFLIFNAALAQTAVDEAKLRLIAQYTQDNCYFLTQPIWDSTINVPGLEVV